MEPAKLFRVERIKPYKGCPYWEKRILRDLGLGEDVSRMPDHDIAISPLTSLLLQIQPKREIAIVKNIPENNARLWKIKHLLKITPITFPFGEPTAEDLSYTKLTPTGECIVVKEIKVEQERLEETKAFQENPKRLDGVTLTRDTRLRWVNPWQT